MLSAPVKSAKRISSLFSLGSAKDSSNSASPSPPRVLSKPTRDHVPSDKSQSNQRPRFRHVSAPQFDSSDPRSSSVDQDSPLYALPPPPPLSSVNQDLANSASSSPDGRPQSRGRLASSSRPASAGGLFVPGSAPESRPGTPSRRRSWMPGRTRASSMDNRSALRSSPSLPAAWIAGLDQKVPYDLGFLARGEQIPELWNEQGDTYVYLFPQSASRPPSFKVDSALFVESPSLSFLAHGRDPKATVLERHMHTLSTHDPASNISSPTLLPQDRLEGNDNDSSGSQRMAFEDGLDEYQELHLFLPVPLNGDVSSPNSRLSPEDMGTLILYRNLFAFLLGQSLVATPRSSSLFSIFMDIATLLSRFEFSNLDGSNFGETVTTSFGNYCDELHLSDVRRSREKTIEAIVLGERLRFFPLYLEGFVHGVGKLDELKQLRSPKYDLISPITQKRLERSFIDLDSRLRALYSKLDDFDFPSIFAGIANSTSSDESKALHFKAWKASFMELRRFILQYYRQKYGSWPPKARSKKNHFEESGLNRLLLRDLYDDFSNLYDLLVDRTSLTTRTTDLAGETQPPTDQREMTLWALRQIEGEYDRSTPPVQPPIPFDVPQFPALQTLHRKPLDAKKESKQRGKKLKDADINSVLMGSYNRESIRPTPLIEAFMQFERRSAHGKTIDDIIDIRCGQWIFIYAVLQSLPLLVVDVLNVRYADGVEYFLCVAPRGGAPWIHSDGKVARSWFGVAGGTGVVSMPSDVVVNGVEGVYRRSHCWRVAEQWVDEVAVLDPPPIDDGYDNESSISSPYQAQQSSAASLSEQPQPVPMLSPSGLVPPPVIPRAHSPGYRAEYRSSIYPGLEALPLPPGVAPVETATRPVSRFNPSMSFDDILKQVPQRTKK